MAKGYKREGALSYGANRRLPLTHESVLSAYLDNYRPALEAPPLSQGYPDPVRQRSSWSRFLQYGFPSAPRYSRKEGRSFNVLQMLTPSRVAFCVRRKMRREVLFSYRRIGFSGSSPGPYRRNQNSQYRC